MVRRAVLFLALAALLAAHAAGPRPVPMTEPVETAKAEPLTPVCGDLAKGCKSAKPHELAFPLLTDGVARAEQRSAPFFAVILKTVPLCESPEPERLRIQALFPASKVFARRDDCDGSFENNVYYANVGRDSGFIAVYAGETRGEAAAMLEKVKALKGFPGANIRRTQVIYAYP
jgi:hypothetical protein